MSGNYVNIVSVIGTNPVRILFRYDGFSYNLSFRYHPRYKDEPVTEFEVTIPIPVPINNGDSDVDHLERIPMRFNIEVFETWAHASATVLR